MTFDVEHSDPIVIAIAGSVLGGPEAMEFTESIRDLLSKGASNVVVDLGNVDLMNSSGLGMLVAASRTVKEKGGSLAVAGANERIAKLFEMTRLDSVFSSFEKRSDAIESMSHN